MLLQCILSAVILLELALCVNGCGRPPPRRRRPRPRRNIDGDWTDWGPYGACSVTCDTGYQVRSRTCTEPEPRGRGLPCEGEESQTRPCAEWSCPDCSRVCTEGSLSSDCTVCKCDGQVIEGAVVDSDQGEPLYGVQVYHGSLPTTILANTTTQGQYSIEGLCASDISSLQFRKTGYITKTVDIAMATDVQLQFAGTLAILTQPADHTTFAGRDVSLMFEVDTPVGTYEWFKLSDEGEESVETGKKLMLMELRESDGGTYVARVTVGERVVISRRATVTVVDANKADTCTETPEPDLIKLPDTCSDQNDKNVVDMGRCVSQPCARADSTGPSNMCCGVTETDEVLIVCDSVSYSLTKNIKCGCDICPPQKIKGTVKILDEDGNETTNALKFLANGNQEILVEDDGGFVFDIGQFITRLTLDFTNSGVFPVVRTFKLADDLDPREVFDVGSIILRNLSDPIDLDLTTEVTLPLGQSDDDESEPAVSLTLQPGAITTADGQPVTQALAYVSFNDPRDINSLSQSPGEFSFLRNDGEQEDLETYGVITLFVTDMEGNQLDVKGEIQLEIDADELGVTDDALLWGLNIISGVWEPIGGLQFDDTENSGRSKRQANRRVARGSFTLPRGVPYVNIDKPLLRGRRCYVRVKLYSDQDIPIYLSWVQIYALHKSPTTGNYMAISSSSTYYNGAACLAIPCGVDHEIVPRYQNGILSPSATHHLPRGVSFRNSDEYDEHAMVTFRSPNIQTIRNGQGPFHQYRGYRGTCFNPEDPDYHFSFFVAYPRFNPGRLFPVEPEPGRELSWYDEPEDSDERKVCMVRLDVAGPSLSNIEVIATSLVEDEVGEVYGTFVTGMHHPNSWYSRNRFACIQVRCPGFSSNTTEGNSTSATFVDVKLIGSTLGTCTIRDRYYRVLTGEGTETDFAQVHDTSDTGIQFSIEDADGIEYYGTYYPRDHYFFRFLLEQFGYYVETGPNGEAYSRARSRCLAGFSRMAVFNCNNRGSET